MSMVLCQLVIEVCLWLQKHILLDCNVELLPHLPSLELDRACCYCNYRGVPLDGVSHPHREVDYAVVNGDGTKDVPTA